MTVDDEHRAGQEADDALSDVGVPGGADTEDAVDLSETDAAARVEGDLAQLANERNEYLETLRRVQADFENYRKRMLREQTSMVERATDRLVEQLLPVLDSFALMLNSAAGADESMRKGIELVFAELLGVLEKAGLQPIDALGKAFDPTEHEAVMQDDGDGEPVVSEILRVGYRIQGRMLRPAMVKVSH